MRRQEKAIPDRATLDAFIRSCQVCRLGLCDHGEPYIVPMCFGYDGQTIFLHCAREGRKIDVIRQHNRICFEFDRVISVESAASACSWGMRYQSVIGTGTASLLERDADKLDALNHIMAQYSAAVHTFSPRALDATLVIRVDIESINGKQAL